MKERPILFKGDMVRAVLEGRKTQTRRPVKPQPLGDDDHSARLMLEAGIAVVCPFGHVGDRLWVRETYGIATGNGQYPVYRADAVEDDSGERSGVWIGDNFYSYEGSRRWFPSIHMPRSICRITLEITGVRVERLKEIGLGDLWAEGFRDPGGVQSFINTWDSIYASNYGAKAHLKKDFFPSDANPWVWVVEFKQVKE